MSMLHELINPDNVTGADIAVFIPSYEEAANITVPVKKAAMGLKNFYPDRSAVIVNCDNPSGDQTREAFFQAECAIPRIYAATPPGVRGKGANLANAYRLAAELSAKAVVVLDANLISIKSTWIPSLVEPILDGGFDYVAPLYVRHRYDSPISRAMVYPLTRTLYGRRVMQPISTDHAFSARLNEVYRKAEWEIDDRGYKSDLKMLALATINEATICQTFMAHPRVTTLASLDHNLSKAFSYVVKAQFNLMMETGDFWSGVSRSRPTAVAGADKEVSYPPPLVEVDRNYLISGFIDLGRQNQGVWRDHFSADLSSELDRILARAQAGKTPIIEVGLWRDTVFQAAAAYKNLDPETRPLLAASLSPLFFIKGLSVNLNTENVSEQQYNAFMENEALYFEKGKPELLEAWFR